MFYQEKEPKFDPGILALLVLLLILVGFVVMYFISLVKDFHI